MLEQTLRGFTQMLSSQYAQDCLTRVVNLVQIALQSAFSAGQPDESSQKQDFFKLEIVRNQVCFGTYHCRSSFISLRKLHEIA